MSIDIVYYSSPSNAELEKKLASYGSLTVASGEDRRSFLIKLSEAVGRSDVIIAVGAVSTLTATLAKGLGMPLAPVDWNAIGIAGEEGAALPQGALPLIVDGSVYGMIIESASQCIIAVDNDETAVAHLTDTYILAYIDAVCGEAKVNEAQPETEQVETEEIVEAAQEPAEEDDFPCIQPVEHFEEEVVEPETDAPDIFADIEEDDFLIIDDRKRSKGWLIALICVIVLLVAGAVGGYFGYTAWWLPKQYDQAVAAAKVSYKSTELSLSVNMPEDYIKRFEGIYAANSDAIGWISADGISLDSPIVTEANKGNGYYSKHLFDGTANKYGTPYIKFAYDKGVNSNPNLIIYGNNYGDSRAFGDVERLLTQSLAEKVSLRTDLAVYGEESWRLFSVMLVNADGSEYAYYDNFASLTADERAQSLAKALSLSKVSLGFTEDDFSTEDFSDTYLTLVTPSRTEKGKVVVAMAIRVKSDDDFVFVENEPDVDDYTNVDSNEASSADASSD